MNNAREYLTPIFDAAIEQAESGKGDERHGHGMDFMEQDWAIIVKAQGVGFPLGQAQKKIMECASMKDKEAQKAELLGAMNYLAMACLHIESRVDRDRSREARMKELHEAIDSKIDRAVERHEAVFKISGQKSDEG